MSCNQLSIQRKAGLTTYTQTRCVTGSQIRLSRSRILATSGAPKAGPVTIQSPALTQETNHSSSSTTATTPITTPAAQQKQDADFSWLSHWYPVHVLDMIDPARPHAIEVLGKQLVLWRDGQGTWNCFEDACPHRLAPLSEGRIEADGTLQCSYHGWRFDGSGTCTEIPQAIDDKAKATACSSRRSCVTSYPVREDCGLLWVWPTAGAAAAAQAAAACTPVSKAMREATDVGAAGKVGKWYRRCLTMSVEALLENINDPSHLPFSHHNLTPVLVRSKGAAMPFRSIVDNIPAGDSPEDAAARPVYSRSDRAPLTAYEFPSAMSPEGVVSYSPPGLVVYRYKLPTGSTIHTELLAVPAGPGRSVVYTGSVTSAQMITTTWFDILKTAVTTPKALPIVLMRRALQKQPSYKMHLFSSKLFDMDNAFVAMQDHILAQRGNNWQDAYYMPTPCDGSIVAARRWLSSALQQPLSDTVKAADVISLPAGAKPLTKREINDRYEQHTKHCKLCLTAMQELQRKAAVAQAVAAALGAAAVGVLAGVLLPSWLAAAGATAAGAWGWVALLCAVGAGLAARTAASAAAKVQEFVYVEFNHADNH